MCLQLMPHMARNTLQKVAATACETGRPEITWQPFFDKARESPLPQPVGGGQVPPKVLGI